jgi:hypothetical protein
MLLKVLFAPSEERGYTASVPSLPGCISYGVFLVNVNPGNVSFRD